MVGELRWSCYIILLIIFKAPLKDETFLSSVAFEEPVWLFIRLSELCIYIWFSHVQTFLSSFRHFLSWTNLWSLNNIFSAILIEGCEGIKYPSTLYVV